MPIEDGGRIMNFFNVIEDIEDLAGSVVIGRYKSLLNQYLC